MKAGEKFLRREPEKFLAVAYGLVLHSLMFKHKGDVWILMVAVEDTKKKNVISFTEANSTDSCWHYFYEGLTKSNCQIKWYADRYYGK